jgi:hypothetical protein
MADDNRSFLPAGFLDVSTVASNGDQNPYGVAFVPDGFPSGGPLGPGDILVSNFNHATTPPSGNVQGTGTTIVRVAPDGEVSTFFTLNDGVSMRSPATPIIEGAAVKGESRSFWPTGRTWLLALFTAPSKGDVKPCCPPLVAFTPSGPLVYQWRIDRSTAQDR